MPPRRPPNEDRGEPAAFEPVALVFPDLPPPPPDLVPPEPRPPDERGAAPRRGGGRPPRRPSFTLPRPDGPAFEPFEPLGPFAPAPSSDATGWGASGAPFRWIKAYCCPTWTRVVVDQYTTRPAGKMKPYTPNRSGMIRMMVCCCGFWVIGDDFWIWRCW